jgi:hypothetical protein
MRAVGDEKISGKLVETGTAAGHWQRGIAPYPGKNGIVYVGSVVDAQENALP